MLNTICGTLFPLPIQFEAIRLVLKRYFQPSLDYHLGNSYTEGEDEIGFKLSTFNATKSIIQNHVMH